MTARKALLVDYGGVLTNDLGAVFSAADERAGLPPGTLGRVVSEAYRQPEGDGFVHRFERGEITRAEFGTEIQQELMANGFAVRDKQILDAIFDGLRPDHEGGMWGVVRKARSLGVATGLLSNSWGTDGYPIDELNEAFDDLVISGDVGLRKPDPAIFHLACERLGVQHEDAIFVDDFEVNVFAAESLGITAVLHKGDVDATAQRLEDFLGVPLR